MPTPDSILSLEPLLAPISEQTPSGPDLLLSIEFDQIQRARLQEDASLDQGEWITDRKEADLPFVIRRCSELLQHQTKDLRLAIWLTDAAGSLHGLPGITQGYRLLSALTRQYWDSLHPQPEDGDMDSRIGNVVWLLRRTIELLQNATLLQVPGGTISLLTWREAVALDQAVKRNPSEAEHLTHGKATVADLERLKAAASPAQLRGLVEALHACGQSIEAFDQWLDHCLGEEAPSFGSVKEVLADMLHLARRFSGDTRIEIPAGMPEENHPHASSDGRASASSAAPAHAIEPPSGSGIRSRAEAIDLLQQIAQFFERTEPSSPAAYMAQKAATWARLPLHEWLKHVVKSDDELAQLEEMLGVTRHSRIERGDS